MEAGAGGLEAAVECVRSGKIWAGGSRLRGRSDCEVLPSPPTLWRHGRYCAKSYSGPSSDVFPPIFPHFLRVLGGLSFQSAKSGSGNYKLILDLKNMLSKQCSEALGQSSQ